MINTDIEASVIGGLLIGGYTPDASDVISTLDESAFSVDLYRRAFGEIKRQAKQRSLIDGMMVAEAMGDEYFGHVMETMRKCPSAANLKGYARVVADYHKVRRFTELMDAGKREITSLASGVYPPISRPPITLASMSVLIMLAPCGLQTCLP